MSSDPIISHVEQGVMHITLNRPEKRNALTWPMLDRFVEMLQEAEQDAGVNAIVVRGAGEAFCSGFDLTSAIADSELGDANGDRRAHMRSAECWRKVQQCEKPTIAVVQGYCLAAGMEFVLHCDFAIAADDMYFAYPAVFASGLPDTHMFTYLMGAQWTRYLLMAGGRISAAQAEHMGMVLKTVPTDQLDEAAMELATELTRVPNPIRRGAKAIVNQAIDLMGYGPLQKEAWAQSVMARTDPDMREFDRICRSEGLKAALAWRSAKQSGA